MELELNKIYQGDCLELMKSLPDKSIDLTVTSPPYDNLRTYNDNIDKTRGEHIRKQVLEELYRVTKDGGVVVWVVGDATIKGSETGTSFKQALYGKDVGFNLHDTMIYAKSNPVPQNHNRYEQQREYMFILSKGKPKTLNKILEVCKHKGGNSMGTYYNVDGTKKEARGKGNPIKETKPKTNIWYYSVGGRGLGHPAIFPEQLAEDHILSWSNEGDTILDPFMGSGTTAKMAKINNRNYIGLELSQEYVDIANKRLENTTIGMF